MRRQRIKTGARIAKSKVIGSSPVILFILLGLLYFSNPKKLENSVPENNITHDDIVSTLVVVLSSAWTPTPTQDFYTWPTPTVMPSFTPVPSSTPDLYAWPTPTPNYYPNHSKSEFFEFALSYYDPNIGQLYPERAELNCWDWSFDNNRCMSKMRNGETYHDNYFKAVACPEMYYFQDVIFHVVSPDWLEGFYPCKDTGVGLVRDGINYLDFLLPYRFVTEKFGDPINGFPWSSVVSGYILYP